MRHFLFALVTFGLLRSAVADPKVTLVHARAIALARVPGTVVHEKLKHGKQAHDHYNIKIAPRDHAVKGQVRKVEVDAVTGQILKVEDVKVKAADD